LIQLNIGQRTADQFQQNLNLKYCEAWSVETVNKEDIDLI
jgi:hypothetical protein